MMIIPRNSPIQKYTVLRSDYDTDFVDKEDKYMLPRMHWVGCASLCECSPLFCTGIILGNSG